MWGFSWGQCRLLLPGWYGFGSAIAHYLNTSADAVGRECRFAKLREMLEKWPFFSTLVANMYMVAAKTDRGVASRYAELVEDVQLRQTIFERIQQEYALTMQGLDLLLQSQERLTGNAELANSIKRRLPYLDPLNHLQVDLLKRYPSGEREDRLKRGIDRTINGIVAGLRNTG